MFIRRPRAVCLLVHSWYGLQQSRPRNRFPAAVSGTPTSRCCEKIVSGAAVVLTVCLWSLWLLRVLFVRCLFIRSTSAPRLEAGQGLARSKNESSTNPCVRPSVRRLLGLSLSAPGSGSSFTGRRRFVVIGFVKRSSSQAVGQAKNESSPSRL